MPSAVLRRSAGRQWTLKPQDLAVALKLIALGIERPTYAELARSVRLSPFEAHAAVQRLIAARLAVVLDGKVRPALAALKSFLVHGAPYAFPPIRGEVTIGTPTAHGVAPLKDKFAASSDLPPVWPDPNGKIRGESLLPLYPGLPAAAKEDRKLYELAALVDAVRSGQARERAMAVRLLEERLK